MFNFAEYITPEKAKELNDSIKGGKRRSLKYYRNCAKNDSLCEVCKVNPVWKFADTGMCFACTTGETNASKDYELI